VSFVYRHSPRALPRSQVRILEVGFGAGNNLWFAAREGFQVAGVDASASAVACAQRRFREEQLAGDLRLGNFVELPFESGVFDLAIDRAALSCCGRSDAGRAVAEIRRVLKPGGRFLFTPYSASHTSARRGRRGPDGLVVDIRGGAVAGVGQIRFYTAKDLGELFAKGWRVVSREHVESRQSVGSPGVHSEWHVIAEKI